MKKILLILLTLSLLISSVSCNAPTPPLTTSDTESVESLYRLDLYEDYQQYLNENVKIMPLNFVTYTDLSELDINCTSFYPILNSDMLGLLQYEYDINASGGYVQIYHLDMYDDTQVVNLYSHADKDLDVLFNQPDDCLITCRHSDSYLIYYYEGIVYIYNKGKLTNIIWDRGDIAIRFYDRSGLSVIGVIEDFCYKSRIEQGKAKINAVIPIASPAPAT